MDNRLRKLARALPGVGRVSAERDQLRAEVKRLERRVAKAEHRADKESERELGYVFIVTYGRSGSTLLLGVLNSLPGYLIRGENRDAVYHLYRFHSTCAEERAKHRPGRPDDSTDPFFGIGGYPGNKSVAAIRRVVLDTLLRPARGTRVTGFKEIRWYQPDLPEYVAFLQRVFPGARFVINTRNHEDVAKSKWWAEKDNSPETLARLEKGILEVAEQLGDAAYHVHYDDYVADPGVLRGLIEWLGEEYDAARVAEVMGVRHSAW